MKKLQILVIVLAVAVVAANIVLFFRQSGKDNVPPEITVHQDQIELSIRAEADEFCQGLTAEDSRDGDLTGQIQVEHISQLIGEDTAKVTYVVFDAAGNAGTASRTVRFTDCIGPRFRLSAPLNFNLGAMVTLKDRLTAEDGMDGDVTAQIRVSGSSLRNDTEGVYRIDAQVTNSLGQTEIVSLPVSISGRNRNAPQITLTEYLVYIRVGDEFEPKDYLESVEDPAAEREAKKSAVKIASGVDPETPGTYDVTYTYKGEEDTEQVILTVVVKP